MTSKLKKPVIISEFSSSGSGGDKALWIREAMRQIKKMRNAKAFIIFNVDKEADWSFPIHEECGKEFKRQLEDIHFRDTETDP